MFTIFNLKKKHFKLVDKVSATTEPIIIQRVEKNSFFRKMSAILLFMHVYILYKKIYFKFCYATYDLTSFISIIIIETL